MKTNESSAPFRDRVRDFRRVRADSLLPHPGNWRRHPERQRSALAAALAEIGFADAVLVRETEQGALQLIDGHLRTDVAGDAEIPVLVLDLSEAEAAKLLAVYDPLAALADIDYAALDALAEQIDFAEPQLKKMLNRLADTAPANDEQEEQPPLPQQHQLILNCRDEDEQQALFEEFTGRGLTCRVVSL
jgi:ParB-like chromosome segregation protein Spo0J